MWAYKTRHHDCIDSQKTQTVTEWLGSRTLHLKNTTVVLKETTKKDFGLSSGQRLDDMETSW